ncbi:MAG: hypothetical protein ACR2N4_17500, partial [Jatrophihabitans sp.]
MRNLRAHKKDAEGHETRHEQYQDTADAAANYVSDHRVSVSVAGPEGSRKGKNNVTCLFRRLTGFNGVSVAACLRLPQNL